MNNRRRIFLTTLGCALLAGLAWWALRETEPHYQGKPLSYWLQAYEKSDPSRNTLIRARDQLLLKQAQAAYDDLETAIKATGTNSFPLLLRYLHASDDTWPRKLRRLASKQTLVPVEYTAAHSLVNQARVGITMLGEQADAIVPDLLSIYREPPSPYVRNAVILSLGAIGKNAVSAIPLLVRAYHQDPSPANRFDVVGALGDIHSRPEIVVPILIDALVAKNDAVRYRALYALGKFGPEAKSAVPVIERLMNAKTTDASLRSECTGVLHQILVTSQTP